MRRGFIACAASTLTITALLTASSFAAVVRYPAPSGVPLTNSYKVFVDGSPIDVYLANPTQGDYDWWSFAYFDFSDSVTVKITSVTTAQILPKSYGIVTRKVGDTLIFTLKQPRNIDIEVAGRRSLLLFANPLETNVPKQDDTNVLYYGPGVRSGGVSVGSNQTLYIAGGACIQGRINASGSNITIRGRGIIDGAGINIQNSNHVRVEGVICKGSTDWTITPRYSDSVTIENVKVCNSLNLGDDALDIVNCTNVLVKRCFLRCQDDNIAIKGYIHSTLETATWDKPCSSITVEECALWTDRANNARIGWETEQSGAMKNIIMRNCDVVHTVQWRSPLTEYWSAWVINILPSDNRGIENLLFEDIRINCQSNLIQIKPNMRGGWGWNGVEVGKYVKNAVFRNIACEGNSPKPLIYVTGQDASHYVQDIQFINVTRNGECTQRTSENVTIGPNATNVAFSCGQTRTSHPTARCTPSPEAIAVHQRADGIHVALPGGLCKIRVTNAGGQVVASQYVRTIGGDALMCRTLPAGMYVAHVVAGLNRFAARFFVSD